MKRLRVFVKGNLDVHDSLHSCRIGGKLEWNGINEIIRERFPGASVRIRHETLTRSDALLKATGDVPPSLSSQALPLDPYSPSLQFSRALFDEQTDAIVLSIQPDVCTALFRHRREGYLLYPNNLSDWPPSARDWRQENFVPVGLLDCEASMIQLEEVIDRLRATRDVPVLIYNMSSFAPGEIIHCFQGLDETFSRRVRRFNAALETLSDHLGISIIDVETIVARAGADRTKLDALHLTAEGYRLVAEEVVRVFVDLGLLDDEGR